MDQEINRHQDRHAHSNEDRARAIESYRSHLLGQLRAFDPTDGAEKKMTDEMIHFVGAHADCFERSLLEGHVTASAWILNPERTHTLLIHHIKLNKWLQPGGHCDGDGDVLAVALKEANEETGLDFTAFGDALFDIDNHPIPQRGEIPAHIHYDIRFVLITPKREEELPGNSEVNAIRWIRLEEVDRYNDSESILRMVKKTLR